MKFIRSASTTRREKRSMQYYRVWIYSCNGVLGVTSAIFAIFAAFVLADVRLSLLGGVELYHPTFLYAYAALILQCGVVQTIGCLGAQRLSHKLLSLYWILLLILTIGDVVVGLVWVYKLDKVKFNLRPILTKEFITKYSTDELFTNTWNIVQSEDHCCGVDGPLDYDKLSQVQSQHSPSSSSPNNSNSSLIIDVESSLLSLPESCCIVIYDPAPVSRGGGVFDSFNKTYRGVDNLNEKEFSGGGGDSHHFHPQDGSGGGTGRGWDDGRGSSSSDNVTNQFALGDDPLISYDNDNDNSGGGGGSSGKELLVKSSSSSQELMSDAPHDQLYSDSTIIDTAEEDEQDEDEEEGDDFEVGKNAVPSWNFTDNRKTQFKKKNGKENKHRKRHENHRWKVIPQIVLENNNNNDSSSNQSFPELNNDDDGDDSSSSSFPKVLKLEAGSGESKNRTKLKPHKTQKSLLPTFSFPTKSSQLLPPPTPEPETAEKLIKPFTCQRHLKVSKSSQQLQQQHENEDYLDVSTNPDNTKQQSTPSFEPSSSSSSSSYRKLNPEKIQMDDAAATFSHRKVEKTNDIGDLRAEKNNDEKKKQYYYSSSSYPSTSTILTQESNDGQDDDDENQNHRRMRRRHSPYSESVSSSSVDMISPSAIDDGGVNPNNFKPVAGSHLFSFLHASAFPYLEGGGGVGENNVNSNGENDGSGNPNPAGKAATEIQAAYYFSSSYYSGSPFNTSLAKRFQVYRHGCGMKLIQWVDHVSGILFILGFCIIGFVKICFLVILRTEIREMIEKIQILELDNPGSPSRTQLKDQRLHHVSHPLLAHPHRASTVSAHAYNATSCLPTIKSPEGPCTAPNRLFSKSYQMRRHSNIIGDRSSTHSQETVNMTLLVTNGSNNHQHQGGGGGSQCAVSGGCSTGEIKYENGRRSNPNLSNFLFREEYDPVSISVPNTAKYLRRSSTCSATAHPGGPTGYGYLPHYDGEPRPGPSSRFYHHDTHHMHCIHSGHHARPRLYARNMSIGAVTVHHSGATASNFRTNFGRDRESGGGGGGGGGGSGNCSFSSRDENEILSASMENVEVEQQLPPSSDDEKEKERRDAEIRDWASATACTEKDEGEQGGTTTSNTAPVTVSLGDYTKGGFNHSSDSAESNGGPGGRRNGNNNVEYDIPLSYLGTAV